MCARLRPGIAKLDIQPLNAVLFAKNRIDALDIAGCQQQIIHRSAACRKALLRRALRDGQDLAFDIHSDKIDLRMQRGIARDKLSLSASQLQMQRLHAIESAGPAAAQSGPVADEERARRKFRTRPGFSSHAHENSPKEFSQGLEIFERV